MTDALEGPRIVDRGAFQAELEAVRVREKAHTREGDAIAAARRRLPMVEVDRATPLIGERGTVTLLDAFEGRRMLIAYYFMWNTRGALGLHRRSASCPIFTLATSLTPRSAKARTKRASAIAASWAGRCLGTRLKIRSQPSWLGAAWA